MDEKERNESMPREQQSHNVLLSYGVFSHVFYHGC